MEGGKEVLAESGFLWPLLGFVFAGILLWRTRQPRSPVETRGAAVEGMMQPACYNFGGPQSDAAVQGQGPVGLGIKQMPMRQELQQPAPLDLATRCGAMTARKVAEVERLLLRELEESLLLRAATLASLFHTWRCEAAVLRTGREFEEEFERQRGGWERELEERRQGCEARLLEAAEAAAQKQVKWRQVLALMLDQWSNGDDQGTVKTMLDAWREYTRLQKALLLRRQRIQSSVAIWAQGDMSSYLHLCLRSWHRHSVQMKALRQQQADFEQLKESRDSQLHEEAAKHTSLADAALAALSQRRARARKNVMVIAGQWCLSNGQRLSQGVFHAWFQSVRWARAVRRHRGATQGVMPQLFEGVSGTQLRSMFVGWRSLAEQEREMRAERGSFDTMSAQQKESRSDNRRSRAEAKAKRGAALHHVLTEASQRVRSAETANVVCEVVVAWHGLARRRAMATLRSKAVCGPLLRWTEGEALGTAHDCLLHWKAETAERKLERQHAQELARRSDEWDALLAEERSKCEGLASGHQGIADQRRGRALAAVSSVLLKWEGGQESVLLRCALRAWRPWARASRRLGRKRDAVKAALLSALGASESALSRACVMAWLSFSKQSRLQREVEGKLEEEKSVWTADLEQKRGEQTECLQVAKEAAQKERDRAHGATQLLLKQWQGGEEAGLLMAVMLSWFQVRGYSLLLSQRKASVRAGVLRFCEGDDRAALHICLLDWRHRVRANKVYETEVVERDSKIKKLQEDAQALQAREQQRRLQFTRLLIGSEGPALARAIIAAWRSQAAEATTHKAKESLEGALGEQKRLRGQLAQRRGRLAAAAQSFLHISEGRGLLLASLLRWAHGAQAAARERHQAHARQALAAKHERHLQRQAVRQDRAQLLAACFWELLHEARMRRAYREKERSLRQIEESSSLLMQLRDERDNLEEQLRMAYRQVDLVTETLQKELRTKEELASELREVYDKLRKKGDSNRASYGGGDQNAASRACSSSRPSSAKSGS